MKLIVGLGNPGAKYEVTRHNIGWLALDYLIDEWKAQGPKTQEQAAVWKAKVVGEDVLIVKPMTFMNLSGRSVAPLARFYKCEPSDIIVLQDEVELSPQMIRVKTGGGAAGHNGLKSIDELLGSNEYHRIRLGVGHSRDINPKMDLADYVLARFKQEELEGWEDVFKNVQKAIELIIQGNILKAMNDYNRTDKKVAKKEIKEEK